MSNSLLISDQHYGHSNFLTFRDEAGDLIRPFSSVEEMDELMIERHNGTVRPQDKVYFLGDVCFSFRVLEKIMPRLNGIKVLIKGNHDNLKMSQYMQFFKDVRGSHQLDEFVLTHIPIHPESIGRWAKGNIHGHTHERNVMINSPGNLTEMNNREDPRYINVCVEQINYTPISLEEIKARY